MHFPPASITSNHLGLNKSDDWLEKTQILDRQRQRERKEKTCLSLTMVPQLKITPMNTIILTYLPT
jgi:hypothetical protein